MKTYLLLILILTLTACTPETEYTLHEDDDYFSPHTNDDRDFTQGIKLSAEIPDATGSHLYSIGQNFYTPGHKQISTPQPLDRPYAGFLYGEGLFKYRRDFLTEDTFGLTLGIVGPHSYSGQTQNEFHRLINVPTAKGWGNQIHDELGIIFSAERSTSYPLNSFSDFISTGGLNLGNVYTQAYLGSLFRVGWNLPDFFSFSGIIYPRGHREYVPSLWRAYLTCGPWVRGVARNIFLDGNTFRDSAHIEKVPFVAEGRLGFGVEYEDYILNYTYVVQTREFEGQPNGNDFGEVTLGWSW